MNMRSVAVAAIGVSMLVSTPAVAQLGGVGTIMGSTGTDSAMGTGGSIASGTGHGSGIGIDTGPGQDLGSTGSRFSPTASPTNPAPTETPDSRP